MADGLETERLILRPLELGDAARTQELFPRWEVVKYLNAGVPWPYPADGVEKHYREVTLPAIARGEEWHWTLRLKSAPEEHIGAIGVMLGENNRGFWLGEEWRRRGLMTEAVIAANDYWFEVLGQEVLRAPKAVANAGSRRISEKTGMRVVERMEKDYVCGRLESEMWEITRGEWAKWRDG